MIVEGWKKYFEFSFIEKNRTNGLCKLCKRNYKDQSGVSSNFLKHLKRAHPAEYDQIFNPEHSSALEKNNDINDHTAATDSAASTSRQNRIILSITKNLIVRCNLPLNIVENPGFRDFMKDCCFKCEPISTKNVKRNVIPSITNDMYQKIHETLKNIDNISLTIDGWSDRRCRSFLGITCHFIDQKMMSHAYLLDFVRFKSPHTGENIRQLTEDVLERFEIKEKVFKIITDNASSMIKAYKFGLFPDEETDEHADGNNSTSDSTSIFDDYDRK